MAAIIPMMATTISKLDESKPLLAHVTTARNEKVEERVVPRPPFPSHALTGGTGPKNSKPDR